MSKYKINLFCGDNLEPSSSALNATKHVQWVYDGSGEVNIYVSQRALDALNDTSGKPTYIWLLESKQIIPQYYQWIIDNYEFVTSRVDGIFSCDKELCAKYPKISYSLINAVPWVQDRKVHEKTKLVSMIASNKRMCEGHARRLQFVDKFRDKLDFYGRGFNEISCKEESKTHLKRSIVQSIRDVRMSGSITKAEQEYLEQIGVNPMKMQNLIRQYVKQEAESTSWDNKGLYDFVDGIVKDLIDNHKVDIVRMEYMGFDSKPIENMSYDTTVARRLTKDE